MNVSSILVVLLVASCCLAADKGSVQIDGSTKKPETAKAGPLPPALPAGDGQTAKKGDLKSAETFGIGYYGGIHPYSYGYYPPYYSYYPQTYGYPYGKFRRYKPGYVGGYPYYGYRAYPGFGYHSHLPYWG